MKNVFIVIVLILFSPCMSFSQENTICFGVVTDIHYSNIKPVKGTRIYKKSLAKLQEASDTFARRKVDFVVCLGDVIDGDPDSYNEIKDIFDSSEVPIYRILGNHDFVGPYGSKAQKELIKLLEVPEMPYSVRRNNFLLLFLDSNRISCHSLSPHSDEMHLIDDFRKDLNSNFRNWNGAFGKDQMKWLSVQLRNAERKGLDVICFAHMPLLPVKSEFSAWDGDDILAILHAHPCVKAYICGHHHKGDITVSGNIIHAMMQGMVENESNHFSIITISKNSICIEGFGDEGSYLFNFPH